MLHMTAEEFRQFQEHQGSTAKYHNVKVYVYEDGFVSDSKTIQNHGNVTETFDSTKEFSRWRELQLLQRSGKICNLERQKRLLIQDGFTAWDGKQERPIWYFADFAYYEDGHCVVEDVKAIDRQSGQAQTTEAFRLKWKLLQAKYPDYEFRIF